MGSKGLKKNWNHYLVNSGSFKPQFDKLSCIRIVQKGYS